LPGAVLEQAEGQEDGEMVTEKLTQQAIADMVGQWQW